MSSLLIGEKPEPLTLLAAVVTGLSLASLVVVSIPHLDWRTGLLALLAADIGAGLVSNATEATRKAWREIPGRRGRMMFIGAHMTIYPAALFWLASDQVKLAAILTGILAAKVLLFMAGQRAETD